MAATSSPAPAHDSSFNVSDYFNKTKKESPQTEEMEQQIPFDLLREILPTNEVPSKLYCPSCNKYTRPLFRMVGCYDSWWNQILCKVCLAQAQEVLVLHHCPSCNFVMNKHRVHHDFSH